MKNKIIQNLCSMSIAFVLILNIVASIGYFVFNENSLDAKRHYQLPAVKLAPSFINPIPWAIRFWRGFSGYHPRLEKSQGGGCDG